MRTFDDYLNSIKPEKKQAMVDSGLLFTFRQVYARGRIDEQEEQKLLDTKRIQKAKELLELYI